MQAYNVNGSLPFVQLMTSQALHVRLQSLQLPLQRLFVSLKRQDDVAFGGQLTFKRFQLRLAHKKFFSDGGLFFIELGHVVLAQAPVAVFLNSRFPLNLNCRTLKASEEHRVKCLKLFCQCMLLVSTLFDAH